MRALHDLVVGNEWASAFEFWQMAPGKVWWLIEAMMPEDAKKNAEEFDEMVTWFKSEKAKEAG